MIPPTHYAERRRELLERLDTPLLLFSGGHRPRNYADNHYPDRADSNFLFLFPAVEMDSAAFLDPADGQVTLFLRERTEFDALWEGPLPPFDEMRELVDVDDIREMDKLEDEVTRLANGRPVHSVAVADSETTARARAITGLDLDVRDSNRIAPDAVQVALSDLRIRKRGPEVEEMRRAGQVTGRAFARAMAATRPDETEHRIYGILEGEFLQGGGVPGYPSIVSVRGETLHNHSHANSMRSGDLLLVDAGAEVDSGYGADVTRVWPVNGKFTPEQRDVYSIVLAALRAATEAARPGVRWLHVHQTAARVITQGLIDLGLMRGDVSSLVDRSAHAVFFPHGVGHLIGLDTHDLRCFGDRILYGPGRSRSSDFGTSTLRIDLDLTAGMAVTVEPGLYFVPGILHWRELREKFADCVDFDAAEGWLDLNDGRGFGGIRLENDVILGEDGVDNLTGHIPIEIDEVEAIVGSKATS